MLLIVQSRYICNMETEFAAYATASAYSSHSHLVIEPHLVRKEEENYSMTASGLPRDMVRYMMSTTDIDFIVTFLCLVNTLVNFC